MALSRFPTIPDFTDEPASIGNSLRAVKESVEQLTGQRQGQSLGAPVVYVQPVAPEMTANLLFKIGDQWINTLTNKMSFWNGAAWIALT